MVIEFKRPGVTSETGDAHARRQSNRSAARARPSGGVSAASAIRRLRRFETWRVRWNLKTIVCRGSISDPHCRQRRAAHRRTRRNAPAHRNGRWRWARRREERVTRSLQPREPDGTAGTLSRQRPHDRPSASIDPLSDVGMCLIVRFCDDSTSVPVSTHSSYSRSSQHPPRPTPERPRRTARPGTRVRISLSHLMSGIRSG